MSTRLTLYVTSATYMTDSLIFVNVVSAYVFNIIVDPSQTCLLMKEFMVNLQELIDNKYTYI